MTAIRVPEINILGIVPYFPPVQITLFATVHPRLVVMSLDRATCFYEHALGFDRVDGSDEVVVSRERASICLCEGRERDINARDGDNPWDLFIWVTDCASLRQEFEWRNAKPITRGPQGVQIVDPDEYVLWFVQEEGVKP